MLLHRLFFVLAFLVLQNGVQGASILALFSSLSFADHLVFRGYVSLLAQRGHSVALMTPYPGQFRSPVEMEKVVELDVGETSAKFWDEYRSLITNVDDYHSNMKALHEFSLKLAIAQLKSKQMTALFINPNVKFDLVITEADVPLFYAVAEKYKAAHIALTASTGTVSMYESKGCPTHPLFYPDVYTVYNKPTNTWHQFTELIRYSQTRREYYGNYLPLSDVAAKKLFNLKKDLIDVEKDIDMLFIGANPILIGNRPVTPGVVFVDRLHIRPGLPLPQELKTVMDNAVKGVVYFSLGAIQASESLAPHLLKTLSESFKELPYTVLWKIGNASVIDVPPNVIAHPWFPQQEILAHPNTKAFITHGGTRSLEEAVFYEVPIVGFPTVKSRKTFMLQIVNHEAGEIVDPYSLDKETFKSTIVKVANSTRYKQAISLLKSTAQSEVISGPDHAIWWTEYVLRHAKHHQINHFLRSPVADVSTYQYYMIDTLLYLFVSLVMALAFAYFMVRYVVKKFRERFFGYQAGGKFKAL